VGQRQRITLFMLDLDYGNGISAVKDNACFRLLVAKKNIQSAV